MVSLPPPDMGEKSFTNPPVDTMVRNDTDKCKWCGRKMLSVRCQCGWVKPINK